MKWEYKVIEIEKFESLKDSEKLQQKLNSYGEEGWELVGVLHQEQIGKGWLSKVDSDLITFKRQI